MSVLVRYDKEISTHYNPAQNFLGKVLFLCEIAPYGKSSISIFQEFFASIDKNFILEGMLSTTL